MASLVKQWNVIIILFQGREIIQILLHEHFSVLPYLFFLLINSLNQHKMYILDYSIIHFILLLKVPQGWALELL